MSEPVLSRVQVAPFADVLFLANIDGAPDVAAPTPRKRVVRVKAVEVRYVYQFGQARWTHAVKLLGHRVHADGTAGTSPSSIGYGPDDEMPSWLRGIVNQNRPPFILPDMRVCNA